MRGISEKERLLELEIQLQHAIAKRWLVAGTLAVIVAAALAITI